MRIVSILFGVVSVWGACNQCPFPALNITAFLPCLKPVIGEDCCVSGRPLVNNPCVKIWLTNPMLAPFVKTIDRARVACKVDQLAPCAPSVAQACPTECGVPSTLTNSTTLAGTLAAASAAAGSAAPSASNTTTSTTTTAAGAAAPASASGASGAATPCRTRAAFEENACGGRIGCASTQCNADGSFVPQQCRGSTGYCWCVDRNGEEIADTRKGPGQPRANCASLSHNAPAVGATTVSTCHCPPLECAPGWTKKLLLGTEGNCCKGNYHCVEDPVPQAQQVAAQQTTTPRTLAVPRAKGKNPKSKAAKGKNGSRVNATMTV